MTETKRNPFRSRASLLLWAMDLEIRGRSDAQHTARKLLIWLCSVVGIDPLKPNYMASLYALKSIAADLDLTRRTLTRTLKRLESQKIVTVHYTQRARGKVAIYVHGAHLFDGSAQVDAHFPSVSGRAGAQLASGSAHIKNSNEVEAMDEWYTPEQWTHAWQDVADVVAGKLTFDEWKAQQDGGDDDDK